MYTAIIVRASLARVSMLLFVLHTILHGAPMLGLFIVDLLIVGIALMNKFGKSSRRMIDNLVGIESIDLLNAVVLRMYWEISGSERFEHLAVTLTDDENLSLINNKCCM